ncbi:hypothetical protein GCK72_025664 [Caenorhabditis remanei]|uniref:Uncharacterized protein n=1 Tax=Caenorhabditis remanei TaxID=31234 RepID=A0A6A5G2J9_CAERE|nr:hypothetical protein GCK72_025664 [Caenorhabditis remanei]KAF1749197.1 hypothetical protein GCK72_025664 [Caenorhabditis remanei]
MTSELSTFGFLCELNDETIYTIERGIIELKNTGDLKLGAWYDIWENELEPRTMYENKRCEVWEHNGEVFAQVLAIGPNSFFLDKDISQKYKYAVWSPLLKFLDDGYNLFKDKIRGDDVVEIVVKYAPWKNGNFKIVELIEEAPFEGSSYCRLPPWTLEQMGRKLPEALVPKLDSLCINQFKNIQPQDVHVGVCIKAEAWNPAFPQRVKPKDGVNFKCSYLFTPTLGLVRWVIQDFKTTEPTASHPAVYNVNSDMIEIGKRTGKWVSFNLCEENKYRKSGGPISKPALIRATAVNVKEVSHVPRVTRVVGGEAETIETHRQNLEPQEAEKLQKEAIVVSVTAVVHNNFMKNFKTYPKNGIFFAKEVDTICYLNGGRIIYQK